jgi:2-methylcitrate dehydratase PrpD
VLASDLVAAVRFAQDEAGSADLLAAVGKQLERAALLPSPAATLTAAVLDDGPLRRSCAAAAAPAAWPWAVAAGVLAALPGSEKARCARAALLGAEIGRRLADCLGPEHAAHWALPGSVGVIGATVTAGLLLDLGDDRFVHAIGIAASMTGGFPADRDTPLGGLSQGFAAANGVLAALLAQHGLTSSATALEGPRGLLAAFGARDADAAWLTGFGADWSVLDDAARNASTVTDRSSLDEEVGGEDLAGSLAGFAAALTLETVPEPARHAARRAIANAVALAVDAARHPAVEVVAAALRAAEITGTSRVVGRTEPVSAFAAALLAGYAMHVEDFDDTHLPTVLHPGAPVVAAALAAAQLDGASGAEVLLGVVAGIEVGIRVAIALGSDHFDRGWHVSGTAGHVAAAAAAARVLGLDGPTTRQALVIAAAQASGVTEQLGSMTKALHVGRSAADGLNAALLARAGMTTSGRFGGPDGFAAAMTQSYAPSAGLGGLGQVWQIESNAFKPYSCGIVSHPVIDAAIAARAAGLPAADITRVVVTVRPVVLEVMGVAEPVDGLQSKFSVYHCFAVGLLDGGAGPAQYTGAGATDPQVVALRRKVEAVTDPSMAADACRAEVWDVSGARHVFVVDHATGSVDAPMTDEQLAQKVRLLVEPTLGPRSAQVWQQAMTLDDAPDLDALFAGALK